MSQESAESHFLMCAFQSDGNLSCHDFAIFHSIRPFVTPFLYFSLIYCCELIGTEITVCVWPWGRSEMPDEGSFVFIEGTSWFISTQKTLIWKIAYYGLPVNLQVQY